MAQLRCKTTLQNCICKAAFATIMRKENGALLPLCCYQGVSANGMTKSVTLYLEDWIIVRTREIAVQTGREMEDILAEWTAQYADNLPVEALSNEEVLTLCHYELPPIQRYELRQLLSQHRARALNDVESPRLNELLLTHRRGIVRKTRALQVAAARGLTTNLLQQ